MNNQTRNQTATNSMIHRTYKDRVFTMIFSNPEYALQLYNAINGTDYRDSSLLQINTLENAIYMGMRNDLSFVIDSRLSLYEHQSTYSPNLPLRFLMYVADEYSSLVRQANLYSMKAIKIPAPHFIVFYNGQENQPERREMRLSDLYEVQDKEAGLELTAVMLNINKGHNKELLESCQILNDYAEFTAMVRELAERLPLEQAVEQAVNECIAKGILEDFLRKNKSEVCKVCIYEYDEERHLRQEREEAFDEGIDKGKAEERISNLLKLLELRGEIPDYLRAQISKETDYELLGKWFTIAAQVGSVREFEDKFRQDERRN